MGGVATFLYECPCAAPAPLVIFWVLQVQQVHAIYATIDNAAIVMIMGVSHGAMSIRLSVAFSAKTHAGTARYKHSKAVFWGHCMEKYIECFWRSLY